MTRELFHFLAILGLTFFAGQDQVLMAQSAAAATGIINAPFGARPGFPGIPVFQTGARQSTGSHSDAAGLGLTKQKVISSERWIFRLQPHLNSMISPMEWRGDFTPSARPRLPSILRA
jgi:hypothetical protein